MPIPFFRIQDVADILIMTFLVYQLYIWFRRTRSMQVLLGLGVVTLIYFATRFLGLYMTSWVLQELGTVLIVLVIVVFQGEIRQALYRFSLLRHFFDQHRIPSVSRFNELATTLFDLAEKRTGAIVVLQREEELSDLMLNGVRLDAEITPQMLETIFYDGTPLHDGAVLIKDGRIECAACHLPLSANPAIPQHFGTRHRAAVGLSERSDAVVLVVSEERGQVSCVVGGELSFQSTAEALCARIDELVQTGQEQQPLNIWQRLFSNLLPKVAFLLLVTAFWALVTSRQGQIATVNVPVRFHGVDKSLLVVHTQPEELELQLKMISSLAPPPGKLDIVADIDLSELREGQSVVRVKSADVALPPGMVIASISPPSVKIVAEKKIRKKVPVKVVLRGRLPKWAKGYQVVSNPSFVEVEGAAGQVARIDQVVTEEIDAAGLVRGKEYQKNLQPTLKNVILLRDEPITFQLKKTVVP